MPKIIFKKKFVGVRILCRTITTLTRLNELNKSTICEQHWKRKDKSMSPSRLTKSSDGICLQAWNKWPSIAWFVLSNPFFVSFKFLFCINHFFRVWIYLDRNEQEWATTLSPLCTWLHITGFSDISTEQYIKNKKKKEFALRIRYKI